MQALRSFEEATRILRLTYLFRLCRADRVDLIGKLQAQAQSIDTVPLGPWISEERTDGRVIGDGLDAPAANDFARDGSLVADVMDG